MEDITPALLSNILTDFSRTNESDDNIKKLKKKIEDGSATYTEANKYALLVSGNMKTSFERYMKSENLPNGKCYYNIAERIISATEHEQYEMIAEYAENVQKTLNKKAKIGIKAQRPSEDETAIHSLVNVASNAVQYDHVAKSVSQGLERMGLNVIDRSVKANAEIQANAGLNPKIMRKTDGKCCEWCSKMAGVYDYPDNVPDDVYKRHNNCGCTVEYDPGSGKRQNVWNKRWQDKDEYAKIEYRKTVGLNNEYIPGNERSVRANWKLSSMSRNKLGHTIRRELGNIDIENTDRAIKYFSNEIRKSDVEHAVIIDRSGKVIHFQGSGNGVDLFDVELEGAHILHNHPKSNGIVSFGKDDYNLMQQYQNAVYDLSNEEYDYHVEIKKDITEISYSQLYYEALQKHDFVNGELQDEAMQILADRGYIVYEKRRIKRR